MMEEPVVERKSRRESGVHKMRTREAGAAETHAAAMPTTAAMPATTAATAVAVSERRCRTSKCRAERTRDKTAKELVVHPNVLRG
jgi:TPP-dependent indolepyruvate ferredoxin oxidoreductase alpha subunit